MNATQTPERKLLQQRLWIRIAWLIGLIAVASPRVPRYCNRSFSRFALMELTSSVRRACVRGAGGKLEHKASRLGCMIQSEEYLRLIYLNHSFNCSTSLWTRASWSTLTHRCLRCCTMASKKKLKRLQSAEWNCQIWKQLKRKIDQAFEASYR